MSLLRSLARNVFRHRRLELDLDEEVRSHFELLVEQQMASGMDEASARRATRLELGGADQVKEAVRDARRGASLEQVWLDLRHGARALWQAKAWTAVMVGSLALGIGANTALFSATNGLLFRKLPVSDPDTLVRFRSAGPNQMRTDVLFYGYTGPDAQGRQVEPTFSYPMYLQFVADNRTMSGLFACAPFGSPNVIGTPVRVNNVPVTIVGVLPPEFTGVEQVVGEAPDVSLPIALEPQFNQPQFNFLESRLDRPNWWWLEVGGRLKPGVSAAQVQGSLTGVFQQTARAGFDSFLSSLSQKERSRESLQDRTLVADLQVDSASRGIYDVNTTDVRAISVLTAVVALVLLLVCANVANLLLSRATAREKEVSVRLAPGATRARLIRQLLTESLLLAGVGGTLGILVARWGQQLLPGAAAHASPLDWRVLAFVITVTTLTGIVFGIAPALRATRADVNFALKANSQSIAAARSPLGRFPVVVQVAISVVLLIGAGLFLRTLQNLRQVDLGFNPRNVTLFQVRPALNRYEPKKQNLLYDQIGERLRTIAGVRSVAWSDPRLMSPRRFSTGIFIQGRVYSPGQRDTISSMGVSPMFFETMEMTIVAGRGLTSRDTEHSPPVVVINEAAARKYFPNESPIGRRIGSTLENSGRLEIVGILRDAKYNSVRDAALPTRYTPFSQSVHDNASFEVRSSGDPLTVIAGIRNAVRLVDPNVPLIDMRTQLDEVERRLVQEKVFAQAYTLFGGLALLVASVGLFGLMSYSVARRTNEIGIRMALGAQRQDVVRLVMRESMILVAAGIVIGVGGATSASRLVSTLLFGLAPTDATTMAGAMTVMVLVAGLAGYVPARRASGIDPIAALRYE
jgi:predicted permease